MMDIGDKDAIHRFLLRNSVVTETGCRIWSLYTLDSGYGLYTFTNPKRTILVHRLMAYCKLDFNLDSKLYVCHKCDTPSCIEETHLYIGTQKQNIGEASTKGRMFNKKFVKPNCPAGHPYSGDNLYEHNGRRICRECVRQAGKRYRQSKVIKNA